MKKRALVFALAVVMGLSTLAFAGWHVTFEQNPLLPDAELTVGWDFGSERLGESNLFINGDFFIVQENLWIYPNPWICGFDLGLNHEGVLYFDMGMDVQFEPLPWPNYVELNTWSTNLKLTGEISPAVTVWGNAEFLFNVINPPGPPGWTGIWTFTPTLGIEIRL